MVDHYAILEVSRTATNEEIKTSYRRLARRWHPDKNPDNRQEAAKRFREISDAYEVLSDEKKRKFYDKFGTVPGCSGVANDEMHRQMQAMHEQLMEQLASAGLFNSAGDGAQGGAVMFMELRVTSRGGDHEDSDDDDDGGGGGSRCQAAVMAAAAAEARAAAARAAEAAAAVAVGATSGGDGGEGGSRRQAAALREALALALAAAAMGHPPGSGRDSGPQGLGADIGAALARAAAQAAGIGSRRGRSH